MNSLSLKSLGIQKVMLILIMGASLLAASLNAYATTSGVTKITSKYNFSQTISRLERGLSEHNLVILKTLNQYKMLAMIGVRIPQSETILVINPKVGAQIYAANPAALIAIPFRILVQQRGNHVVVYYQKATALFRPYAGLESLGRQVTSLIGGIVKHAVQ